MGRLNLDAPLLQLSTNDQFTVRDALQGGLLITGGTGSGKTSGPGATIAGSMLRAGWGGIVLCAKPEEAGHWVRLCRKHGRGQTVIRWNGRNAGFNFVAYELARHGAEGINNVIECLMRVLEFSRSASALPSKGNEAFWDDTMRQVLRHAVPLLYAASGNVRIDQLLAFVRSAPNAPEQMRDPDWQKGNFFCEVFTAAAERLDDATGQKLVAYWQHDFARLDPKTRGNIVISLTTALDRFNHGWMAEAFCGATTIVPELTFHGAIIILDMPAFTLNEDGIIAQQLFKYMWQRAVLARNSLPPAQQERPCFLWADEAQHFLNSQDAEFLSACRGSRANMVFLSQSLPTYYARMGGENAHDRVHHMLGNFGTTLWLNNNCAVTNEYAAKMIGRSLQQRANYSQSHGESHNYGNSMGMGTNEGFSSHSGWSSSSGPNGQWSVGASGGSGSSSGESDNVGRTHGHGSSHNVSQGFSMQMDHLVEPASFARHLKTGGPKNGNRVSGYWMQAGRCFHASGLNLLQVEFVQ